MGKMDDRQNRGKGAERGTDTATIDDLNQGAGVKAELDPFESADFNILLDEIVRSGAVSPAVRSMQAIGVREPREDWQDSTTTIVLSPTGIPVERAGAEFIARLTGANALSQLAPDSEPEMVALESARKQEPVLGDNRSRIGIQAGTWHSRSTGMGEALEDLRAKFKVRGNN